MNLVRWLRKNNKKIMAIVVIVILVGFIGGGTLLQQLGQRKTGLKKIIAYFGKDGKIRRSDLLLAQQELEILKILRADILLKSINMPLSRTQDLCSLLLGELLFFDRTISPQLVQQTKQMIRLHGYRISDKQLNDIYSLSLPTNWYWLLLKTEAQQTGIRISNDNTRQLLEGAIPQIFEGTTYPQLIGSMVDRQRVPEDQILQTAGKLLAVLQYAKMTCTSQNITDAQIRQAASLENETIDVEFVKFDSSVFAENQSQPTQQQILDHFDRYKKFFAGTVTEENPYGFGYKLYDRVQLEYIAVKLDDISGIIQRPTQEETEQFYQRNRQQFTERIPQDPNDPNSLPIERVRSYVEMADAISKMLLQNKINSKAGSILQEAKTLTEAALETADTEAVKISSEEFAQLAGDYQAAAEKLTQEHKIKVYTGRTGLLSAADMQADEHLRGLFMTGYGRNTMVRLTQIVFAVDEIGTSELGPFDVQKPRMHENIGPVRDITGQVMLIARVIDAQKASEPQSIEQTFSRKTLEFEQTPESIYSVKEKVVEDLKRLAAMDTAKNKAEEFNSMVAKDGWDNTVDKFNKLYGTKADGEPNNVFETENLSSQRRMSSLSLQSLALQSMGIPAAQSLTNQVRNKNLFTEKLYAVVPQDSNSLDAAAFVFEFKPDMSYYCIKNISVNRLDQSEYEEIKGAQIYKEEIIQSQSLAPVHFNPENILKRMSFRLATDSQQPNPNAPGRDEGNF